MGVIGPTNLIAVLPSIFKKVSRYNEPENNSMPVMKQLAAHFIHWEEKLSNKIATASNASAWYIWYCTPV